MDTNNNIESISTVNEYLEDAISTLAMIHHGLLQLTCANCNKELMEEYNHNIEPRDNPVWFDQHRLKEYYACPIALIPPIVISWYDKYRYVKDYGMSEQYDDTDALFWWFIKTYEQYSNKYESDKINTPK